MPSLSGLRAILGVRLYHIRNWSMAPSVRPGDWLVVHSLPAPATTLRRGDVVVVADPRGGNVAYVKRVVGLPGEEVRLADGVVRVNGVALDEPYLDGLPASPGLAEGAWAVGDDACFLMGDNRAHGTDSRHFGPLPLALLLGRATLRAWPPGRWGRV